MIWQVYLFLGVLGFVLSIISFSERLAVDAQIGASAVAFLVWLLWAFSSYNVETVTNTGTTVTSQYGMLVIVGIIASGIMFIWSAWNVMRMFGMTPERLLEVRL